jgi:hypothetical protein
MTTASLDEGLIERLRRDFSGEPFDTAICRDVNTLCDRVETLTRPLGEGEEELVTRFKHRLAMASLALQARECFDEAMDLERAADDLLALRPTPPKGKRRASQPLKRHGKRSANASTGSIERASSPIAS